MNDVYDLRYNLDTVSKQQLLLPVSKAFTSFPQNEILRVFQLDGLSVQQEVVEILRSSLFAIFDIPLLQSFRYAYQDEVALLLDMLLYRYSTWQRGQSVGDRLQNLVMRDEDRARSLGLQSSTGLLPALAPQRRLLAVHAVLSILVPYVVRKLQRRMLEERWEDETASHARRVTARLLRYICIGWALLSLLNTLHFFATGSYRTLLERLLSIKMVYGSQKMERLTNLMILKQHLMWQTWASLFSVLRVGRYVSHMLQMARSVATTDTLRIGQDDRCCVCNEKPTISQRSNCGHLYCYYCIRSRLLNSESTGSFRCFKCGQSVHSSRSA